MNEQQKSAFSSRFPGLDEGQISRLIEVVDSMGYTDPIQKLEKQRQLYQQVLPSIKEKQHKIGRMEVQNQLFSRRESAKSTGDFVKNDVLLKTSEFADLFRSAYGLPSKVSDDKIMEALNKGDPDFKNKFARYLSGDKEVLQEMGIGAEEPETEEIQGAFKGMFRPQGNEERNDNLFGKLTPTDEATTVGGVFKEFGTNALKSTVNLASDIGNMVANPWDTAKGFTQGVLGGIANAVGADDWLAERSDFWAGANETADAMGKAIVERYGSREKLSHTAYTDPVGVFSDIMSIAALGGGLAKVGLSIGSKTAKAMKLTNTANTLQKAGNIAWDFAKKVDTFDPADAMMRGSGKFGAYAVKKTTTGIKALDLGEKAQSIISGLDKETIKGIQNNPYVKEYWGKIKANINEQGATQDIKLLTRPLFQEVGEGLLSRIEKAKEIFSETGPLYGKIREVNARVDISSALDKIDDILSKHDIKVKEDGSFDFDYSAVASPTDQNAIKTLIARLESGKVSDTRTVLNLRKVADGLSKWDGTTTDGLKVVRDIRRAVDEVAKEQVPGLKELDELYRARIDDYNEIREGLVYKMGDRKGEIRDNFNQIIKTIGGENRARMAERLNEIAPDLVERVDSIHSVEKIAKAYTSTPKVKEAIGSIGGVSLGSIIGWNLLGSSGSIIGAIVGSFGNKVLSKISKSHLDKIASTMSPEAIKKLEAINAKLAENVDLSRSDKYLLNTIKEKIENYGEFDNQKQSTAGKEPTSVDLKDGLGGEEPSPINPNKRSIQKIDGNANKSYQKIDGTEVVYENRTDIRGKDFSKRQFSNKHQLPLAENMKGKTHLLEAIKLGELEKGSLGQVPAEAFHDGKARPLELSSERYAKIFQKHGPFSHENLIATANDWDYLIKDLNGKEGHINLIKELPDGSALLIGAKKENGAFMLTHFEPTKSLSNILKDVKKNGGEVIEKGLGKLREGAETKATTQLHKEARKYKSAEEFVNSQEKVYHGSKTDLGDVELKPGKAGSLGAGIYTTKNIDQANIHGNVVERFIDPEAKVFDFTKMSPEQIIDDIAKSLEKNGISVRREGTKTIYTDGLGMVSFDGGKSQSRILSLLIDLEKSGIPKQDFFSALGYDVVKFGEGMDQIVIYNPKVLKTEQQLKAMRKTTNPKNSLISSKISKLIGNSLENNYNGVKPDRLDGEKLSLKEAETLLTKSGKNLKERILIGIDKDGNLVLEDGRHLLEAYRILGKEIPSEKLGFNGDKAKKLFEQFYSE